MCDGGQWGSSSWRGGAVRGPPRHSPVCRRRVARSARDLLSHTPPSRACAFRRGGAGAPAGVHHAQHRQAPRSTGPSGYCPSGIRCPSRILPAPGREADPQKGCGGGCGRVRPCSGGRGRGGGRMLVSTVWRCAGYPAELRAVLSAVRARATTGERARSISSRSVCSTAGTRVRGTAPVPSRRPGVCAWTNVARMRPTPGAHKACAATALAAHRRSWRPCADVQVLRPSLLRRAQHRPHRGGQPRRVHLREERGQGLHPQEDALGALSALRPHPRPWAQRTGPLCSPGRGTHGHAVRDWPRVDTRSTVLRLCRAAGCASPPPGLPGAAVRGGPGRGRRHACWGRACRREGDRAPSPDARGARSCSCWGAAGRAGRAGAGGALLRPRWLLWCWWSRTQARGAVPAGGGEPARQPPFEKAPLAARNRQAARTSGLRASPVRHPPIIRHPTHTQCTQDVVPFGLWYFGRCIQHSAQQQQVQRCSGHVSIIPFRPN